MTESATPLSSSRSLPRRLARAAGVAALAAVIAGTTIWAALAVAFANLTGAAPRYLLAAMFLVAVAAAVVFLRPRKYGVLAGFVAFAAVLAWFFLIKPSNDRDWWPDVAQLASAEIDGDRLTVRNVRNFHYRSETDFTPAWEDRSYDLNKLRSTDFALCYWGSKTVAHGIVSFNFDDGAPLAISIETRKEKSESYSAVQGFFRQYELIYVLADERDVLRLRTNHRGEEVFLYRTRLSPAESRAVLLSYVQRINSLRDEPEFYNALTTNCITSVVPHAQAGRASAHIGWELLLSGYAARQAYNNGILDRSMPFEQLEARSRITDPAIAADADPDFSNRIRVGLPMPAPGDGPDEPETTTVTSRPS